MVDRYAEASLILEALTQGYDPITGELFPDDSPLAQAPVLRALFAAKEALSLASARVARTRRLPRRAGKPWDPEEDRQLVDAYRHGTKRAELARQHERTSGAIASRLVRLGEESATEHVR